MTKVHKVFKVSVVKTEPKVYQDATAVMAQQVVTDVMAAMEKNKYKGNGGKQTWKKNS